MRGYLSIRKILLADMVFGLEGVRGLAVSLSAGLIAGCLAASLRFHLGLPGHKAFFWMTPVIAARLLDRCRVGTTAGALSAAFVSIGLASNLAGDAVCLPLVGAAGALIDVCINYLEKNKASVLATIMGVALSAMLANLICCAKRLLAPAGLLSQDISVGADLLLRPMSYGFFGFLAGLIAAASVHLTRIGWAVAQHNKARMASRHKGGTPSPQETDKP